LIGLVMGKILFSQSLVEKVKAP